MPLYGFATPTLALSRLGSSREPNAAFAGPFNVTLLLLTASLFGSMVAAAPQVEARPISNPLEEARIEIFKGKRELYLFSGDRLVRIYQIGLGFDPVADKSRQGDGATPEGQYFVCVKNPQSRYYLSLGINYPNAADAEHGLERGRIVRSEHDDILQAERRRVCPPWSTAMGGEIFIHGRGAGADWTLGCVALNDPEMKELYDASSIGTPVVIRP